jgi:hypothetical protein
MTDAKFIVFTYLYLYEVNMKFIKFFIFSIISILGYIESYSQDYLCDDQCGGIWSNYVPFTYDLTYTDENEHLAQTKDGYCHIECNYRWRVCQNGEIQFEYSNISISGNCLWEQNFNLSTYGGHPFNFSSVNEMIDVLILSQFSNVYPSLPQCPNTEITALFYTASCGIWISCLWDISSSAETCPNGYIPHPSNPTGTWKWQTCGTTCCKRTYNVCKQLNGVDWETKIVYVGKSKSTNCTQEPGGTSPKYARICDDGC